MHRRAESHAPSSSSEETVASKAKTLKEASTDLARRRDPCLVSQSTMSVWKYAA